MRGMQNETGAPLTGAEASGDDPTTTESRHERPRRWALQVTLAAVAVLVLALDQLTKAWALHGLDPGHPVNLVGRLIRLDLITNPGAAFSFATGNTLWLTVFAVLVLGVIVVVARRLGSRAWAIALGLLLGGALGNLVDRLVRPPGVGRGHVVDFIDYFGWFIGNVADIAIVVSAVVIAYLSYQGYPLDGSPRAEDDATHQPVRASHVDEGRDEARPAAADDADTRPRSRGAGRDDD